MTREEIKKQWELEFGVKYKDYQRANVYTATDILDFAESVVNKLSISDVSNRYKVTNIQLSDCEIETTYTKPYSESNHAKAVNYFGADKVRIMSNDK